jgi:hypothetical protein
LKQNGWRRFGSERFFYLAPLLEQKAEVANKIPGALAFSNRSDDYANALRDLELL